MTKAGKRVVILVAGLVCALVMIVCGLFHGYFDRGQFEVKNAEWSPSGRVALIAERSDHGALSSDIYFVLVGDHLFSSTELRHAYYGPAVIFAAAAEDCLALRWKDPRNLVITCGNGSIDRSHINLQRNQVGDVIVSYVNIPTILLSTSSIHRRAGF